MLSSPLDDISWVALFDTQSEEHDGGPGSSLFSGEPALLDRALPTK